MNSEDSLACETFDNLRPHFNSLARAGCYKVVNVSQSTSKFFSLHKLYRGLVCFFIGMYNVQQAIFAIASIGDTQQLAASLFLLLTTINAFNKILIFNLQSDRIQGLINLITSSWFKAIAPLQKSEMDKNAKIMKIWLYLYQWSTLCCCLFLAAFPYYNRMSGSFNGLPAYFPFDTTRSPAFEVALVYSSTVVTWLAYGHVTMDSTIIAMYSQAAVQIRLLKYDLEHLTEYKEEQGEKADLNLGVRAIKNCKIVGQSSYDQQLVLCVEKYTKIVWFVKEIESIFSIAMLVQFFVQAWVICMTLYKLLNLHIFSVEFYSMVLYLLCMMIQIYIYCYYGSCLQHESDSINNAVYSSRWTELTHSHRGQLLIVMSRYQASITPKAGRIIPLSLNTFIGILKASYSLFTILSK